MILFQTFIQFPLIAKRMLWYSVATKLHCDIFQLLFLTMSQQPLDLMFKLVFWKHKDTKLLFMKID